MDTILFGQFRGPVGPVGGGGGGECICALVAIVIVLFVAFLLLMGFLGVAGAIGAWFSELMNEYRRANTPDRARLLIRGASTVFVVFFLGFALMAGISLLYNNWKTAKSWTLDQVGLGWEWVAFQPDAGLNLKCQPGTLAADCDGKRVLALQDGKVAVVEEDGKIKDSYHARGTISRVVALADRNMVVAKVIVENGRSRHALEFWHATYSWEPAGEYSFPMEIAGLAASSNGKSLAVLTEDGSLTWIKNAHEYDEKRSLGDRPATEKRSGAIAILGRSRQIVEVTSSGLVRLHEADSEGTVKQLRERDVKMPLAFVVSDRGGYDLAVGPADGDANSPDRKVLLLDPKTLDTRWSVAAGGALAFSPDGAELVIGTRIHWAKDGSQLQDLRQVTGGVPAGVRIGAAAYFNEGKRLVLLGDDGNAYVFKR